MSLEFIARNGIISRGNIIVTGSLTASGSLALTNIGSSVFSGSITQIDSTASFGGLVGIGTTTPIYRLDIVSTATFLGNNGGQIGFKQADGSYGVIGIQGGGWGALGLWGPGRFTTSVTPDLRIFGSNGAVSIANSNNLLVGANPSNTARVSIQGSGTTSSTTSLLVQSSTGGQRLKITDDGSVYFATNMRISNTGGGSSKNLFANDSSAGWGGFIFNSATTVTPNSTELLVLGTTVGNGFKLPLAVGVQFDTNTTLPLIDSSAQLQVDSTTKGFLPPRTNLLSNISSPAQGLQTYITASATEGLYYYNSGSYQGWTRVLNNSGSQSIAGNLTITGSFTVVTGSTVEFQVNQTGVKIGNATTDLHSVTGSLSISASVGSALTVYKSGSTVVDIQGSQGSLMSIEDSLTGSLMSVGNISGLPLMEVFDDGTMNAGKFNVYPIRIVATGSQAVITGSFTGSFSGNITATTFTASSALVTGNVTVLGTASINNLIINQIGYSSGSNQLGDAANDTQTLYGTVVIPTGSLTVSGSLTVTGSSNLYGPFYNVGTYWETISGSNFQANLPWRGLAYGNGLFVAAADRNGASTSLTGSIATSQDGVQWTFRTLPALTGLTNIIYQNGIFVAIGKVNHRAFYSYNGVDWFQGTGIGGQVYGLAYGDGKFIATLIDNSGTRMTLSYNGRTWIGVNTPTSMDLAWVGATYGNGTFVAVAESTVSQSIAISYDGLSWNNVQRPTDGGFTTYQITYGNGLFVVTGNQGKILTSPDGINWTIRQTPLTGLIWKITYAEGLFIAAGSFSTTENRLIYSYDGITWKEAGAPSLSNWSGFAYGNGMLLSVAFNSTGSSLIRSGILKSVTAPGNNITHGAQTFTDNITVSGSATNSLLVRGSGATSSTTALRVENTNASASLVVLDNGFAGIGTLTPSASLHISGSSNSALLEIDSPAVNNILYVSGSGNIGIGTGTPSSPLHIKNSAPSHLGGLILEKSDASLTYNMYVDGSNSFAVSKGASQFFTIDQSGNAGIGISNPTAKLTVKGSGATSSTTSFLVQNANASGSMVVLDDGNVGIGTTAPAAKLDIRINQANTNTVPYLNLINDASGYVGYTFKKVGSNDLGLYGNYTVPPAMVWKYISGTDIYVGVGTTTPSYKLDVSGSGNFTNNLTVTGSFIVATGSSVEFQVNQTGVKIGNATTDSHSVTGSIAVSASAGSGSALSVYKSGSTVLDIQGSSGQLFSVTDSLTGSLFSVNTVAGLPVMEAFSDNTVNIGKYGTYPIKVVATGSLANITGSFSGSLVGIATTASYVATASYTPTLQQVTTAGNSTTASVTITGTRISEAGNVHFITAGYGSSGQLQLRTAAGGVDAIRVTDTGLTGIGTTSPSAKLHVVGSGTTSSTTALLVQNANASASFTVKDDGYIRPYYGINFGSDSPSTGTGGLIYSYDSGVAIQSYGAGAGNPRYGRLEVGRVIPTSNFLGYFVGTTIGTNSTIFGATSDGGNTSTWFYFGNNLSNIVSSAIVNIDSTNRGLLIPRTHTTSNISSPAQGLQTYITSSSTEGLYYYNSGSYQGWTKVLNNSGSQSISGSFTVVGTSNLGGATFSNGGGTFTNNVNLGAINEGTGNSWINFNTTRVHIGQNGSSAGLNVVSSTQYVGIGKNTPNTALDVLGDVTITGSLNLTSTLTASSAVINGNVTVLGTASIAFLNVTYESASVIYSSGSNQLGDALDDTQTLYGTVVIPTGSLIVTGSLDLKSTTSNTATLLTLQVSESSASTLSFTSRVPKLSLVSNTDGPSAGGTGPDYLLELNKTGASGLPRVGIRIINSGINSSIESYRSVTTGVVNLISTGIINGSTEVLTVAGNLNVGINNIDPTAKLTVKGSGATSSTTALLVQNANASSSLQVKDDGSVIASNYLQFASDGSGGNYLYFFRNSTNLWVLGSSGVGNIFTIAGNSITLQQDTIIQRAGLTVSPTITSPSPLAVNHTWNDASTVFATLDINVTNTLSQTGSKLIDVAIANTSSFVLDRNFNLGIKTSTPSASLHVVGNTILSGSAGTGSALQVYKSGSTVMSIQGSQGELFSITDSLSGSLFSVSNISGLPILEVFSDNTTLVGDYLAPALITTKKTTVNSGSTVIYNLPTASYDGGFFDYTIRSGSNARAGQIMAIWSGTSVNHTEIVTSDFGNTNGFTFGSIVSGSNMALTSSASTSGWTLKTIIRSI